MDRIEKPLWEVENLLIYLASHEDLSEPQRAALTGVLESHLETVNRWKMARISLEAGRV